MPKSLITGKGFKEPAPKQGGRGTLTPTELVNTIKHAIKLGPPPKPEYRAKPITKRRRKRR